MSSPSVIRWLQISDLNLKPDSSFAYDVALTRLIDLYNTGTLAGSEPDLIFCTGDVTASGLPEEYELASRFFLRLSEVTKVPLDRIFTVPGNHDLDRSRRLQAFRLHLEDSESSEAFFASEEDLEIGLRPIRNYLGFEHRVFGRIWNARTPFVSVRSQVRGLSVAVLGFSTAWQGDRESVADQVVGYPLVQRAFDQVRRGQHDLTIVLMHHPVDWLTPFERLPVQRFLSQHADFVLNGHVHSSEGYVLTPAVEGAVTIGSGSWERNGQRSFVTVDVSADKVLIRPYRYADAGAGSWEQPIGSELTLNVSRKRHWAGSSASNAAGRFPFNVRRYIADLERSHEIPLWGDSGLDKAFPPINTQVYFVPPDLEIVPPGNLSPEIRSIPELVDVETLLRRSRRVVILGNPGAGKSTLLRSLLFSRARAFLPEEQDAAVPGRILPILLKLPDFAPLVRRSGWARKLENLVHKMIEPYGGSLEWVTRALANGRILVLLDGLDEVGSSKDRKALTNIIGTFAARWPGVQIVLTSRLTGFESVRTSGILNDFLVCHLRPFSEQQAVQFIHRVFSFAVPDRNEAEQMTSNLTRVLQQTNFLEGLATSSPRSLSTVVWTYLKFGVLPAHRFDLFQSAIEVLTRGLDSAMGTDRPFSFSGSIIEILERLALSIQEHGRASIGASEVDAIVRGMDLRYSGDSDAFLRALAEHSGLMTSTTPNRWCFVHRSFQEHLAASAIAKLADPADVLSEHMTDPAWREVTLLTLAASWRRSHQLGHSLFARLTSYVTKALSASERPEACGLLAAVAIDAVSLGAQAPEADVFRLRKAAVRYIEDNRQPGSNWARVQLARLLGMTGDPRVGWEDERHLVVVPGGPVVMGAVAPPAAKHETPPYEVFVSRFLIGRYSVTNSQFAEFVESGAYQQEKYWSGEFGRRTDLRSFQEALRTQPNLPVTEVSWFEADAFCRWLNDARPRRDGLRWRLPTEAEWEKAARGGVESGAQTGDARGGRTYPWGNDWADGRANAGGVWKGPTPVGLFPSGAGPYGTQDQAGNVGEWCQDGFWWYGGQQRSDPLGMTSATFRAVRGGDWSSSPREVRASAREWRAPAERKQTIGFRVVASAVTPIPARPSNPFRPGIALPSDAPPPGRLEMIAELTSRIQDRGSSVLLGPRRSGKTSILRYLQTVLGQRARFLDLQGHPCRTPDVLAASLEPSMSQYPHPAAELRRLLAKEDAPVILLDELGRLRDADSSQDPNVFEWLRSLAQEGAALVLAGTVGDWDLAQAKDAEKPGSSFANIMKPMHLGPLLPSEAEAFLVNTAPDDVPIDPVREGRWLVELTGGWPFYLQVVAHAYVEERRAMRMPPPPTETDMRHLYERALLQEFEFVFRQQWRELGRRTQTILLQGSAGHLPDPLTLSPGDIEHLERQCLFHQQRGWLLENDKPFLEWMSTHYRGLVPEGEEQK